MLTRYILFWTRIMEGVPLLTNLLLQLDGLLSSAVVIVAFSLLAYIALQNWHTAIARALCVLLAGVVVVFGGDVLLGQAQQDTTIQFLLRAQWLGIVCVPAGYIHLSDALLTYSDVPDRRRRWLVYLCYGVSAAFFALALSGELLLRGGIAAGPLAQLGAGPLFWLFALYFALTSVAGLLAIWQVRRSALTPTMRRRLTYLGATFLAPGLAVFPYLVIAGAYALLSRNVVLLLSALGNAGVAVMITIMVYSIAFQGLLLPDRLIKQDFIRWGLYGPFVGVAIILFLRSTPVLARWLGLPYETLLTFGVMIFTVLMPIFVSKAKPYLDALVFMQDHAEIDYLRTLPRNTFTQADLRSLLENTLEVICGALRVDTGFVAAPDDADTYTIKTLVGARRTVKRFVGEHPLAEIMPKLIGMPPNDPGAIPPIETFLRYNGFCLLPLRDPEGEFLGALGVAYPQNALTQESRRLIGVLAHQIEMALATVHMQQRLYDTLRAMGL